LLVHVILLIGIRIEKANSKGSWLDQLQPAAPVRDARLLLPSNTRGSKQRMQRKAKFFFRMRDRHPAVMDVSIRKRRGFLTSYPQNLWKRLWKGGVGGPAGRAFSGMPEKRASEAKHRQL
jgi:hypothetical protein